MRSRPVRSTDSHVFVCVEGDGATETEGKTMEWSKGDVFVVPSWKAFTHRAAKESVLFGISDKPAQQALGLWREDRPGS